MELPERASILITAFRKNDEVHSITIHQDSNCVDKPEVKHVKQQNNQFSAKFVSPISQYIFVLNRASTHPYPFVLDVFNNEGRTASVMLTPTLPVVKVMGRSSCIAYDNQFLYIIGANQVYRIIPIRTTYIVQLGNGMKMTCGMKNSFEYQVIGQNKFFFIDCFQCGVLSLFEYDCDECSFSVVVNNLTDTLTQLYDKYHCNNVTISDILVSTSMHHLHMKLEWSAYEENASGGISLAYYSISMIFAIKEHGDTYCLSSIDELVHDNSAYAIYTAPDISYNSFMQEVYSVTSVILLERGETYYSVCLGSDPLNTYSIETSIWQCSIKKNGDTIFSTEGYRPIYIYHTITVMSNPLYDKLYWFALRELYHRHSDIYDQVTSSTPRRKMTIDFFRQLFYLPFELFELIINLAFSEKTIVTRELIYYFCKKYFL